MICFGEKRGKKNFYTLSFILFPLVYFYTLSFGFFLPFLFIPFFRLISSGFITQNFSEAVESNLTFFVFNFFLGIFAIFLEQYYKLLIKCHILNSVFFSQLFLDNSHSFFFIKNKRKKKGWETFVNFDRNLLSF